MTFEFIEADRVPAAFVYGLPQLQVNDDGLAAGHQVEVNEWHSAALKRSLTSETLLGYAWPENRSRMLRVAYSGMRRARSSSALKRPSETTTARPWSGLSQLSPEKCLTVWPSSWPTERTEGADQAQQRAVAASDLEHLDPGMKAQWNGQLDLKPSSIRPQDVGKHDLQTVAGGTVHHKKRK
jgi:hypothetical protein